MTTLAFLNLGMGEILLICFLGLLIFGRRLPEVGRSLGSSIVEFKKGLAGIEEQANKTVDETKKKPAGLDTVQDSLRAGPAAPSGGALPAPNTADLQEQLRLANERIKALEEQNKAKV